VTASREVDQLRFHLAALQQVAHSLAVVRSAEETEKTVVDSAKEVFFAWWAALYRTDSGGRWERRVVRSMRGESLPDELPADVLRRLTDGVEAPVVPAADASYRELFPADLGAIAPLDLGDAASGFVAFGARMTADPYRAPDLAILRALADASAIALRNADLWNGSSPRRSGIPSPAA
jgi:hypothetical protein